jgi:hypothetical protein
MQFLFPSFLFGLLAAAIPVIIHLFNFRRTKQVYFSNVAFLKKVDTSTSSFRKLKQLLIMAARMLFIVFLVLAFAQPFIPSKSKNAFSQAGVTSLYIDNSLSMQNEIDNKSALNFAIKKIEELLGVFQGSSARLQLLSNDFGADEHRINTIAQLKDRIAGVEMSHTARSLDNILKRQNSLAAKHVGVSGKQLFWFSDFQKSTAGDLNNIKLDSSSHLYIVPVQAKAAQNVFVDSVWLSTPFIREMQGNTLSVKLRNTGSEPVSGLSVKLFLDDIQVSAQTISLAARNNSTTNFSFTVKEKGYKKGKISFDDSPISFDNDFYFVLNAAPSIQVMHLFGQASTGNFLPNVFANDSLFVFKSSSVNNADLGLIQRCNLLVIEGLEKVEGSIKTTIENFVKNGGSLLVIPPAKPDVNSYNSILTSLNIRNIQANPNTINAESLIPLANPTKDSPFFLDIFEQSTIKDMMAMPKVSAVWGWQTAGDKLLEFRNGQNFLTASMAQKGKIYMLSSPLDATYGEFARNALFVPVMYKLAALSVRQEPLAYSFRESSFVVDLKNSPDPNAIFGLKQGNLALIPVQKLNGNQLTIELPKTNQLAENQSIAAGYYELQLNKKNERLVAFNHDNKESEMDFYTAEELKEKFASQKNIQVYDKIDSGDFIKNFKAQNLGIDLWKYCIVAALIFLLVEILLIRLMKG